jgi:ribonuclease HII
MNVVMPTRRLEQSFWSQGLERLVGVDEVGRGPLAGPVTIAAVLLPIHCRLPEVRDSKMLSPSQRQAAATQIRQAALEIGIGWAASHEIDRLGLTMAMRLAGTRALAQLSGHELVLLDGSYNYLGDDMAVSTCIKADQTCLAVAAASVIAKVARDSYMELLDQLYPKYGLAAHKGYATATHLRALRQYGPTPYHRLSWRSVREGKSVDH